MSGEGRVDQAAVYERLAVDAFRAAQNEAAELRELARRTPVWEEVAARFAGVTARFAESAAAAALARMHAVGVQRTVAGVVGLDGVVRTT